MGDEDKVIEREDLEPSTGMDHAASTYQETQEGTVMSSKATDAKEPTEGSNLLNSSEKKLQKIPTESNNLQRLRRAFSCPPHGYLDRGITNVTMVVLLWAVVWSITGSECLPGGNLFGIIILFYCAIIGGKLLGLIKLPTLPPLPHLLGMLLAGFLLKNIPVISDNVQIKHKWSSALRSMALSVILVRAGLGLDSKALKKLKGVCVRLSMGPCLVEACTSALLAHFLMGLPWQWGFMLGKEAMGLKKASRPYSWLLAASMTFWLSLASTHAWAWPFPQAEVEKIIAGAWYIFQPLLFGLIGAEVSIASLRPETVGLCVAILGIAVLIRILATFLMVCFAGFNIKEKIFISFAWLPKATVQAAIGSVALDTARSHGEKQLEEYGMDVLTVAFLSILITAPIGSLLIGLLGPRLLQKAELQNKDEEVQEETSIQV
ncbi:sodium/hydrogen exchanger 9B2 isoform X3 [Zalophus californianus]|uniref:Sodium/hydrogen exchanger 9B2 isoform X3 n=1 Tax=Zalophus californianus TaxID=9704 RepID=A0A6J2DFG1_ZALCA|nr:sodium/hydrogen exchanger 9B2 isoform X3 [Zalophus californianus]